MASSKKECFIKTRYFIKSSGSVCCIVVSGDKQYTTCLHANGSTSCDCSAHEYGRTCKHIKLVVASEQARYTEKLQSFADRYQAFVEACRVADEILSKSVKPVATVTSIENRGTLNGRRDHLRILPSRQEQEVAS